MERLLEMLTYRRPHGGEGERLFVEKFIEPYAPIAMRDPKGEVIAWVVHVYNGNKPEKPVLWSSHVDTVHHDKEHHMQEVVYDENCGVAYKQDQRPLGADCGAGVWIMLEMIDAGVEGTYIFHRAEECGGVGSAAMAKHHATFLQGFSYAIAFDRRDTKDVIYEQFLGQTASVEFAAALADELNKHDEEFEYEPSDQGIFTDTANYADLIPECTNVSVGYVSEHTGNEMLDTWHLQRLRDTVIKAFKHGVDLPVMRDPAEEWRWTSRITALEARDRDSYEFLGKDDLAMMPPEEILLLNWSAVTERVRKMDPADIADLIFDLAEKAVDNYTVPMDTAEVELELDRQALRDGTWDGRF